MNFFSAYPAYTVRFENKTVYSMGTVAIPAPPRVEPPLKNPAPGICLPVIVSFCQYHKVRFKYVIIITL